MTILYFADLADPSLVTRAVDLNALPTDPFGFQLRDVDWGDIETEATWQTESAVAGAEQIRRRHGVVTATLRLHYEFADGGTYEDLLAAVRLLGQYLDSHGVLVWQPEDEVGPLTAAPVYIDTYPSPIAALFRGQERGGLILERLLDPEGYTFEVWRHPYPRRAPETVVAAVSVDNSIGGNVVTFTNTGSALSEGRLTIEVPGASDSVVQVRAGLRSGDVTEFAASFTNYAITAPAAVADYWKLIHSKTLIPTGPEVLAGTYRVLAQVQLDDDVYTLQCRWGNAPDSPQGNSNEQVELDAGEVESFALVEVDLGLVTFAEDASRLTIEIWAKSETGINASWGNVTLVPASELYITASSPGFRAGRYGLERWDGSELAISAGVESNDDGAVFLDALNESAEVKPTAGRFLPVGRHILEFRGNVRNKDRTRSKRGELQVINEGDLQARSVIRSKKGRIITRYADDDRRRVAFDVVAPDDLYRFRVIHTEAKVVGRHIRLNRLRHWFIPVVNDGKRIVLDALQQDARVEDSAGNRLYGYRTTALPYLEPGDGALVFSITELAPNGHDDVDLREPLPAAGNATGVVTLEITPRELQP